MSEIEITGKGFDPASSLAIVIEEAKREVLESVLVVEHEWKRLESQHTRTGDSLRHITHEVERRGDLITGIVGTNLRTALWRERGTGLYGPMHRRITSPTGKVMSWVGGRNATLSGRQRSGTSGGRVFAMSTAGMRPQRVFEKTMLAAGPRLQVVAENAERRVASRLGGK